MKLTTIAILLILSVEAFAGSKAADDNEGNLPVARQARIKEVVSPKEVDLYAVGIGEGRRKHRQRKAIEDAYKSAVYYLLYNGSEPILSSELELLRFQVNEQQFFNSGNIAKFIVYESPDFVQRVEIDSKKRLKIEKVIRVDVGRLKSELISLGVIEPMILVASDIGYPNIMVLPDVPSGTSPVEAVAGDNRLQICASVIESYLTSRKFDAVMAQQVEMLSNEIVGELDDDKFNMSLAFGSDIYITFSLDVKQRTLADRTVSKASVAVRAFETSTARLLGAETGYSKERPDPEAVVIEEAVKDAIDKVLSRIEKYWKDDRSRGIQYKLVITVKGYFDSATQFKLNNAISGLLKNMCKQTKENVLTSEKIDLLVWANPDEYETSLQLSNGFRVGLLNEFPEGELVSVNINRKLIHFELKNARR